MDTIWLAVIITVISFAAGAYGGAQYFGKRLYDDGYRDGLEDGKAENISLSGACGDCGWEADYADLGTMLQNILSHSSDCPAKRY
jgi:hypothetical protein